MRSRIRWARGSFTGDLLESVSIGCLPRSGDAAAVPSDVAGAGWIVSGAFGVRFCGVLGPGYLEVPPPVWQAGRDLCGLPRRAVPVSPPSEGRLTMRNSRFA